MNETSDAFVFVILVPLSLVTAAETIDDAHSLFCIAKKML